MYNPKKRETDDFFDVKSSRYKKFKLKGGKDEFFDEEPTVNIKKRGKEEDIWNELENAEAKK